jgi:hypothetical protein
MKGIDQGYRIGMVLLSPDLVVVGMNHYARQVFGAADLDLGQSLFTYHLPGSIPKIKTLLNESQAGRHDLPLMKVIDVLGQVLLINFGSIELIEGASRVKYYMTFIDVTHETQAHKNPVSGKVELQKLPVLQDNAYTFLDVGAIYYFESDGNYCKVFTRTRSFYTRLALKMVMERYGAAGFFQVHKSYIVNLSKIRCLETASGGRVSLILTHTQLSALPVARRRVSPLKRALKLI